MSTGKDLVTVGKDAHAVYKAAKQIKKDLKAERKIAARDLADLKKKVEALQKGVEAIVIDPPGDMTGREFKAFLKESENVADALARDRSGEFDDEELLKFFAQALALRNKRRKLALAQHYDMTGLFTDDWVERITGQLKEAQRQIRLQLKARSLATLGIKSGILLVDVGAFAVKAMV